MVRKLSWLVALLALNCSMGVYALGLGDIEMHSALNQPLNADIDLLSVRADDADSIKVILGSTEEFERAGLERPYLLNQLRFLVVAKGKGHYRIHVSTEQSIREPFLDFLIQVTWRGGQLLREYTVLLDPPVLMPAPVQVITAPVIRTVAPETAAVTVPAAPSTVPSVSQPTPPSQPQQRSMSSPAAPVANEYGPIRTSETLWAIANRARPNRSVSTDQMMQAILQANPSAFINNNVNSLKAGQILRIPSASEVAAIDAAAARAATLKQTQEWRNSRASTVAEAPAPTPPPAEEPAPAIKTAPATPPKAAQKPPAAQTPSAAAQTPPQAQAQLKVMAPPSGADATKSAGSASAGTGDATTAAGPAANIQKELALATEAVETQRQETEDLRTRLSDLEQQISTMQKMMTIKDEQLASMQVQANSAAGAKAPEEPSSVLSNPATLAMIGIVAVVLAALLWLAMRRRQPGVPGMQREIRVEPRQSAAPAATAPVAAGAVTAAAVRAANKSMEPAITAAPPQAVKPATEQHPNSDPLSEADIYLAYGRYQQAEDLIKEAMRHDHNPELRLKLLEIYYAAKNATAFEDSARDLRHDVGTDHELWQRALLMGREICPYSLLFGEDQSVEPAPDDTYAATPATAPDSFEFGSGDSDDTVVVPGRFQQEPINLDVGYDGEAAEDTLDEVGTKLDLARAYIDMGDMEGARSILAEVLQEGSAAQKDEAQDLLQKLTN